MQNFNFSSTNPVLHQVIIGQLIAGANITRRSPTRNSYFRVGFGPNYSPYANWLCAFFGDMSKGVTTRISNSNPLLEFRTKTLPIFNYYHSQFYRDGLKVLPNNLIEIISPIILAHIVMSIGHFSLSKKTIELNTFSYSYRDCQILANAIMKLHPRMIPYGISVHKERTGKNGVEQYTLILRNYLYIETFQKLVTPHMNESMLYRVGL